MSHKLHQKNTAFKLRRQNKGGRGVGGTGTYDAMTYRIYLSGFDTPFPTFFTDAGSVTN